MSDNLLVQTIGSPLFIVIKNVYLTVGAGLAKIWEYPVIDIEVKTRPFLCICSKHLGNRYNIEDLRAVGVLQEFEILRYRSE